LDNYQINFISDAQNHECKIEVGVFLTVGSEWKWPLFAVLLELCAAPGFRVKHFDGGSNFPKVLAALLTMFTWCSQPKTGST